MHLKRWFIEHSCSYDDCSKSFGLLMLDGIVKIRREICMSTLSGCNILINPDTGDELKIRTGCKNMPAKGSKFCRNCGKMSIIQPKKMPLTPKIGVPHIDSMLCKILDNLLFIEEIHNSFRNQRKEVLVKF